MYKVLLVEDEDLILKGLEFTFNWAEHDCVIAGTAIDGRKGLQAIIKLHPDIVITDISMPNISGLNMIEEGLNSCYFASIIISGYDEFPLAKTAIGLDVSDYLLKPLDHQVLAEALKKAVNRFEEKKLITNQSSKQDTLFPSITSSSRLVTQIVEFIRRHYSEKIGIQLIADTLQVSYATLCNHFKEETELTINDFISRYRIRKSIELMQATNDTVYIIAEKVGFSDYKYFIRVFSKYIGHTPNTFMQKLTTGYYPETMEDQDR